MSLGGSDGVIMHSGGVIIWSHSHHASAQQTGTPNISTHETLCVATAELHRSAAVSEVDEVYFWTRMQGLLQAVHIYQQHDCLMLVCTLAADCGVCRFRAHMMILAMVPSKKGQAARLPINVVT